MSKAPFDRSRWQAVVSNDPDADGDFFYAVKTTGVYCRPSCASRRPRPENMVFFDTGAQAELAGYRACKRCAPGRASPAERDRARVARACRMIGMSEKPPRLADLASRAGVSPYHFHRLFKRMTGLTPHQYASAERDNKVRARLAEGGRMTDALFDAGFNSSGHFYAGARDTLGMTPKSFRDRGAGCSIRFAIGEARLGAILVAGTERGICAISLGDDPKRLVGELQDRFANAELLGGDRVFERYVARVVGFVQAPGTGLDLPLDIRGTVFQQRVWQALRQIPCGETATYADIAARIGSPKAARAVAGACAANTLALAIPCHRVVRTDGDLSGYRWGVERKRTLLRNEKKR
ncbi:bifunctional DNA-binding transcriptional regulator/O6-methylguanine-DNA methyltransferase Ada [Salinisphaera sp.]|uniref:bifunctional DNA-binding transcriptional regulator/O6-methylguanine-DNA methyltransferase Ada n=1 Tax=Salinisphaera sp. TaxID=1914330 RepID=UPI002D776E01|nr:bifunctional DNA-binding transcriptional regulator/O6-methylguanine-DNA methyltransferase Ada [Salinisphaera sp.]HET7314784.1 bifunctional DNA-binding transcriptional regulator/O6-methylguanine-DNA methyltransferase Ada [Salinisphaera sp.]